MRTSDLIRSVARTAAATALGGPVAGVGVGVNESIDLVSMEVGGRKVDPYETALRKIEKGLQRFARSEHLDRVVVDQALDAAEKLLTGGGATATEIAELNFRPAAVASRVLLKRPSLLVGLDPETRDLCRQIVEAIYQSLLVYDDVPGVELAFRQAMLARIDATQSGLRSDIEALRREVQHAGQSTGTQVVEFAANGRLFSVSPGRLFTLPRARHDATWMGELGLRMTVPDSEPIRSSTLPAGYTFLGQFLLNELAFDPVAAGVPVDEQEAIERPPRLDLASLYGRGPAVDRFLYDATGREGMFLLDRAGQGYDLPRNAQGSVLAGTPGNDTNVILSQLHCVFLRFHNAVLDRHVSGSGHERFRAAQRLVRWHFQWIVVNDYLDRVAPHALSDVLPSVDGAPRFRSSLAPQFGGSYLPVEFSHGAGRFIDGQLQRTYTLNEEVRNVPFLPLPADPTIDLLGYKPTPLGWGIDWSRFFCVSQTEPQASAPIDTNLAVGHIAHGSLGPEIETPTLAAANLLLGKAVGLPDGCSVARALHLKPLTASELDIEERPPLWFYVLREAELQQAGQHLGRVGSRLVAETVLGVLASDADSYLNARPTWTPELPAMSAGTFDMGDLIRIAET